MTLPEVTVLVTVYERTSYIGAAVRVAAKQAGVATEVLVLDDSASPTIRTIVEGLELSNVKYHANSQRMGVSRSIFHGISLAKTDLIAILNDDDIWQADFLHRILERAPLGRDICLWFADHWIADEMGNNLESETEELTTNSGRALLANGLIENLPELILKTGGLPIAQAAIFRRSNLTVPQDAYRAGSSYDFFISILLACSRGAGWYSKHRASAWRQHAQMETHRTDPLRPLEAVYALEVGLKHSAFDNYRKEVAVKIRRLERSAIRQLLHSKNFKQAIELAGRYISRRVRPISVDRDKH